MSEDICSFKPDFMFPPGETIKDILEEMSLELPEFVEMMGIPESHTLGIINGEEIITEEIAQILEKVTSTPSRLWLNMQSLYSDHISSVGQNVM